MLDNGFITLDRKILKWEWYDDPNTFRLFLHLLLTVNWSDQKWHGETIQRGSRVTSYQKLADELKLTVQQVRTAIEHLESTKEITRKSTSKYQIITVVNYGKYQDLNVESNKVSNKQITSKQQASNKQVTTIEQRKQSNKENNIYITDEEALAGVPWSPFIYNEQTGEYEFHIEGHEEDWQRIKDQGDINR